MEVVKLKAIDRKNTARNLKHLRCNDSNLRRYVCWCLKTKSDDCFGTDCENCRLDMDNSISRRELAQVLDVSENTLANWESGRSVPDLEFLLMYSEICKRDLIGGVVIFE